MGFGGPLGSCRLRALCVRADFANGASFLMAVKVRKVRKHLRRSTGKSVSAQSCLKAKSWKAAACPASAHGRASTKVRGIL